MRVRADHSIGATVNEAMRELFLSCICQHILNAPMRIDKKSINVRTKAIDIGKRTQLSFFVKLIVIHKADFLSSYLGDIRAKRFVERITEKFNTRLTQKLPRFEKSRLAEIQNVIVAEIYNTDIGIKERFRPQRIKREQKMP